MLVDVKAPALPESVSDGTLVSWHKKVGDFVHRDENLVDMETDKVMLEITAPSDGVLKSIEQGDGQVVSGGQLLATIDGDAEAPAVQAEPAAPRDATPTAGETPADEQRSEPLLSPAARKLASENNIDPAQIPGTGRDRRVTKADVLQYLAQHRSPPQVDAAPAPATDAPAASAAAPAAADGRVEKRVPMTRLRARIAERLKDAQNTAAILTTFNEINMAPVMALRKKYKEQFLKQHETKLGFMSFFTKAVVEALKQFPVINASIDGQDVVYHGYFDIGIAVGSPRGLVVPVLRDADQMSFAEVERTIAGFGARAREGKLTLDELTGGTFTITNGGTFGSMLSTPILNPPQSAILGMHNITERAVVENGEIVVRPMMYVALSYDHRLIDGHEAVLFLVAVKNALEDPARLLLQV